MLTRPVVTIPMGASRSCPNRTETISHTNPRLTSRIELHSWCLISYHCKELRHINCAKGLAPLGAGTELTAHIASVGFYINIFYFPLNCFFILHAFKRFFFRSKQCDSNVSLPLTRRPCYHYTILLISARAIFRLYGP